MPEKTGPLGTDMTVSVSEDRLAVLKRMQARLAEQVDICGDERSWCLLTTQLRATMAEIAELSPSAEACAADEIAQRRQERRAVRRRMA